METKPSLTGSSLAVLAVGFGICLFSVSCGSDSALEDTAEDVGDSAEDVSDAAEDAVD
ncbi:MAG: hypothetical protein ACI8UO_005211 [Verrucomicrobiales bacterium]|jgi:hypothetical protein